MIMFKKKKQETPVPEKKKMTKGTKIFYAIYWVCVVLILAAILLLLKPLEGWLTRYQASQPEEKCQAVFDELFADPDWEALYTLAEVEDTAYESAAAYDAYMTGLVGDTELLCTETSAGLSGNHKYLIRLNGKRIASFLLTPREANDEGIVYWDLGKVELFFERTESVVVEKLPEQTVYINGTALDDSHTISYTDTLAEDYLPEGVHGYRMVRQQLSGLLTQPEVVVKNPDGSIVSMTTNEEGVLTPVLPAPAEMTEEEQTIALNAAKTNALFSIRAIGTGDLKKHFDSASDIYTGIRKTPVFIAYYESYTFLKDSLVVSDFCRYSDDLFSAHVSLKLKVRQDEKFSKTYESSITYFFAKNADGKYLVNQISNAHVQQLRTQVRLTFMENGTVLDSFMTDADTEILKLPQVTAPAGKAFAGWAVQETAADGNISMTVVLIPDENGTVNRTGKEPLEPMTLYPVFE